MSSPSAVRAAWRCPGRTAASRAQLFMFMFRPFRPFSPVPPPRVNLFCPSRRARRRVSRCSLPQPLPSSPAFSRPLSHSPSLLHSHKRNTTLRADSESVTRSHIQYETRAEDILPLTAVSPRFFDRFHLAFLLFDPTSDLGRKQTGSRRNKRSTAENANVW